MPYYTFSDSWRVYREVIVEATNEEHAWRQLENSDNWLHTEESDVDPTTPWQIEDIAAEPPAMIKHLFPDYEG